MTRKRLRKCSEKMGVLRAEPKDFPKDFLKVRLRACLTQKLLTL